MQQRESENIIYDSDTLFKRELIFLKTLSLENFFFYWSNLVYDKIMIKENVLLRMEQRNYKNNSELCIVRLITKNNNLFKIKNLIILQL